jgi:hypothetical protein
MIIDLINCNSNLCLDLTKVTLLMTGELITNYFFIPFVNFQKKCTHNQKFVIVFEIVIDSTTA